MRNRTIPGGVAWPQQEVSLRDAAVSHDGPPATATEWRRSPSTWAATPLPPDAVAPGPGGPFLRAEASQEYLALAIDTAALAAGPAPPRPGERRQREPPPVDASPNPEISESELPDGGEVPDWSANIADPRPAASQAPLERSLVPHPLAFIHVDG